MITKQILRKLFALVSNVPFSVTFWDNSTERFGAGEPRFRLILRDERILDSIREDFELGFGEAYTAGMWDVDGDLADVVSFTAASLDDYKSSMPDGLLQLVGRVVPRMGRRSRHQQRQDIERHYDLGNDFFELWLDESLSYSCAYFHNPDDSLETAQRQKIDHCLRKVRLRSGETLLDIGCGWGALVRSAARDYGARALGITLSSEQIAHGCQAIQDMSLEQSADVRLIDYKALAREGVRFDKIVSVGMIEHVGQAHLEDFTTSVAAMLRPGGLALLHFITAPRGGSFNAWMDRYIFPGAYLPTLSEMVGLLYSQNLRILDVENLGPHYHLTLDCWSERFDRNAPRFVEMFDEQFVRMWRLYLRGCSSMFRDGFMEVHQLLVSNGKSDIAPLTRDDIYR